MYFTQSAACSAYLHHTKYFLCDLVTTIDLDIFDNSISTRESEREHLCCSNAWMKKGTPRIDLPHDFITPKSRWYFYTQSVVSSGHHTITFCINFKVSTNARFLYCFFFFVIEKKKKRRDNSEVFRAG